MSRMIKTYTELSKLRTFEERFEYLRLRGDVGKDTFGFDRIFNQMFYASTEWKRIRDRVIVRDNGCDLGADGYEIFGQRVIVHHMNPISIDDISKQSAYLLDPEYLITTTHATHNAIHYGDSKLLTKAPVERFRGDTCPWKQH